MAFFDDVKKFGRNITEKSKDVIEITKINSQINSEKDKIKELYAKIGEEVYKAYAAGQGSAYDELCAEVKQIEDNINQLTAKVLELKNAAKCPSCGAEVGKETAFCPKCGTKVN
ncbi:MAG: zinc-ribbon domain-containing protein [Acetivibrionales bacterium]|jgi:rubrerythrin